MTLRRKPPLVWAILKRPTWQTGRIESELDRCELEPLLRCYPYGCEETRSAGGCEAGYSEAKAA